MTESFVPRTLTFLHDREAVSIDDESTLTDTRLARQPLILLGEAGSGKSELLRRWAGGQVATARQITNGWQPKQGRSFVDGLDEAAGLHDGDALDRLLGALEAQRNIDFVIACRVADWRSASGAATIRDWTGVDPVELTIQPLRRSDIVQFLRMRNGLSEDDAEAFVTHYEDRGLSDWLGNPQTLTMFADVIRGKRRPETTGGLFQLYVEKTWVEPRRQDTPLANASPLEVLSALGALFATLIVGGYDALTLAPGAARSDSDLPLAEYKTLPGIAVLSDKQLNAFLGSRLVAGAGNDRLIYQHRRIGEYLGARWLAAQLKTGALRERLLGALRYGGLVPSNLRGLWGWLAEDSELSAEVISTDPLAVIDYGNADTLNSNAAKALLAAIEHAEDNHQPFGWRTYRAAALVHPALSTEVERILAVPGDERFWTQFILLRQMHNADVVARHKTTLRGLMLDSTRPYATRDAAAHALADYGALNEWPNLVRELAQANDRDSLRLALVMMINPNIGLTLSDAEFAETVYAYSGLTARFGGIREVGTVGLYYYAPKKIIGDDRLDGMLDVLTDCARQYLTKERNTDTWDVEHLFFSLLRRRLENGNVDADRLWEWLSDSKYRRHSVAREEQEWLNSWLQANDTVRRALQRKVLAASASKPQSLSWRLHEVASGLYPTNDDVIALLDWLPEGDARWSELLWLAPRREEGEAARAAAARHVRTEEDRQLICNHVNPPPLPVDEEHRAWNEQHEREQRERKDELRADYFTNREQMRSGYWGALVGPAQVYMGCVYEAERDLPPEERIGAWIGEDLQADALAGFEAFLTADPPQLPSAMQIAESHAESRQWHGALILSAALAERQRAGRGFAGLSDERIQAGLFAERVAFLDENKWEPLRDALATELERRGAWFETARLFIEPQLRKRLTHVSWLWRVLASDVGGALAAKWLREFPRITAEPEEELIDHLLRDGSETSRAILTEVAKRRRRQRLDEKRRRNWQAVEFILGTLPPSRLAVTVAGDGSFLWVLRDRMGGRRRVGSSINASPALLAAIVASFAALWLRTAHPTGASWGDKNPWHATDFLDGCLDTLAADPCPGATEALAMLSGVDHGYGKKIARSIPDQSRARANAEWQPHKVAALAKLIINGPPVDHADLQRMLLAELGVVQAKITSSSEDVWRFFFADAANRKPHVEDQCSDALVTLLKQSDRALAFDREKHLGDEREGDIWCTGGGLELAIECKRHWHADLWTAFDWQLAQQQAVDWRARGYGIYVVYWFGEHDHALTGPPRGSGIAKPKSPAELEVALHNRICDANLSTIAVKVLDVSRAS